MIKKFLEQSDADSIEGITVHELPMKNPLTPGHLRPYIFIYNGFIV